MIQIYKSDNTNYTKNGDMVLFPTICKLSMEINGVWEVELHHPIDEDGRWKYILENAVISVDTPISDNQLFRIHKKEKNLAGVVAYALPIFLDARKDAFLVDVRPTNKTGQAALNILTSGTKYTGHSDIPTAATAYYIRKNLIEAISSDDTQSFLNRWGGEIIYKNYEIFINQKIGLDNHVSVRYGKNLAAVSETVDFKSVITRMVPVAFNGHTLDGNTPWVDSSKISKYPIVYTAVVKFEDVKLQEDVQEGETGYATLAELRAELRRRCNVMFSKGVDTPSITLNFEMVDLSRTIEYKDYKILEDVSLGDTIYCTHDLLEIETEARVVALVWDCILQCSLEITIGDIGYDYIKDMDGMSGTVDRMEDYLNQKHEGGGGEEGDINADRVKGILDMMNVQLHAQKDIAHKQDVRAILFEDLDINSPTYGAMALGTQGFQISRQRTYDDRDWVWTTAFTAYGGYADVIVSGLLSSRNTGSTNSWIDLDTGRFKFQDKLVLDSAGDLNISGLLKGDAPGVWIKVGEVEGVSTSSRFNGIGFWDNGISQNAMWGMYNAGSTDGGRTIFTPVCRTNVGGTNRKGISASRNEIFLFADYNSVAYGYKVFSNSGTCTIDSRNLDIYGNISIKHVATIEGGLTVNGGTALNGRLQLNNSLTVYLGAIFQDDVTYYQGYRINVVPSGGGGKRLSICAMDSTLTSYVESLYHLELRAGRNADGTTQAYRDVNIYASRDINLWATRNVTAKGVVIGSQREKKTDIISKNDINAIEKINALNFYEYDYIAKTQQLSNKKTRSSQETEKHHYKLGTMVDEAPNEILDEDKTGISLYEYCNLLAKGIQELDDKNQRLEKRIEELEAKTCQQ